MPMNDYHAKGNIRSYLLQSKPVVMLSLSLSLVVIFLVIYSTSVLAQSFRVITENQITVANLGARPTPAPSANTITFSDADLASIQKELSFTLIMPESLPGGAVLQRVQRVADLSGVRGVSMHYAFPDGRSFSVLQEKPLEITQVVVEEDNVVERMNINGVLGVAYRTGATSTWGPEIILQWTDGVLWFEITGQLSTDEMELIATSLTTQ